MMYNLPAPTLYPTFSPGAQEKSRGRSGPTTCLETGTVDRLKITNFLSIALTFYEFTTYSLRSLS